MESESALYISYGLVARGVNMIMHDHYYNLSLFYHRSWTIPLQVWVVDDGLDQLFQLHGVIHYDVLILMTVSGMLPLSLSTRCLFHWKLHVSHEL